MKTNLSWKKGVFSNLYKVYSNDQQIGKLKDRTLSQTANGELNGKEYTFKTKGFFKQSTEIIDCAESKVIGRIKYNSWMTKAVISVNGKTINWKYDNLWQTRWRIFNSEGIEIKFSSSLSNGQIESNIDDGLLLLTGLFIINYHQAAIVGFTAAFASAMLTN